MSLAQDGGCLIKVVMVGDAFVGKTSLLERFQRDTCMEKRCATIGVDFIVPNRTVFGVYSRVQFWDQAGNERFRKKTRTYYGGAHWLIIMYDISNRESLLQT